MRIFNREKACIRNSITTTNQITTNSAKHMPKRQTTHISLNIRLKINLENFSTKK